MQGNAQKFELKAKPKFPATNLALHGTNCLS